MAKAVNLPGERLAGLFADLAHKIQHEVITLNELALFNQRRDPFKKKPREILTVTSDSRNGETFVRDLKQAGYHIDDWALNVMLRAPFVAMSGVTYSLGIIKGEEFSDNERMISNIRAEAARRGWRTPPIEVATLLREVVSDEDIERMDLVWLVVMHEPVIDSDGNACLLSLSCRAGGRRLDTCYDQSDDQYFHDGGFVFLLPPE